jgi:glycosyltransferase involved in cell wall biosynthesis
MNVLHVFKDVFPPTYGGVEQHIWEVARSLAPGIRPTVLTSSRSGRRVEQEVEGVRIVRVPEYGRFFSTPLTPSWFSELRRSEDAVVHVHLPNPLGELAALADAPQRPLVASYHADVVRNPRMARAHARIQARLLRRADRIVVGSPVLAETTPALFPHRARIVVIPYGVDPDDWPADPERVEQLRTRYDEPIVLLVGRLVHYKGVDVLLEAMRGVSASLVIVGDGPLRAALERTASEQRLGRRVSFVGNVTNRERAVYYQAASVFVLPAVSRAESFGIAMLEAMSYGTAVVSTELGTGTSWVNVTGETGLVVPPKDPAALADAITTLLADDELRIRFGQAAARRAREHFCKRAMLDQLAGLYRSLAA